MIEWHSLNDGSKTGPESDVAWAIIEEPIQACAFCRGKGEKPAGAQCSVCRGKGTVEVRPPAVKCALCRGRGEERPRGNVTCSACRGKGYVTVRPPVEKCASCRGTGRQRGSRLACITCRGAGVVGISRAETRTAVASTTGPAPRPALTFRMGEQPSTGSGRAAAASAAAWRMARESAAAAEAPPVLASELEILRLYARASFTGERIVLSEASGLSPAYIGLLKESLTEKGLLRRKGTHKLGITDRGLKVIRKGGGDRAHEHPHSRADAERPKADKARSPGARTSGVAAAAPAASASLDKGLRWTTLRGI